METKEQLTYLYHFWKEHFAELEWEYAWLAWANEGCGVRL